MKATIPLINALREAADKITSIQLGHRLDGEGYSHSHSAECNCGWLARCLGIPKQDLEGLGFYSEVALNHYNDEQYCSITGKPITIVFAFLAERGLEQADFHDIEFLQNDEVLARAGLRKPTPRNCEVYNDPKSVAAYFRAQADILEEQLAEQFETRPLTLNPQVKRDLKMDL